ncbi:MAG: MFS transporter [Burkholderiaceae bacterium]|nr:MFS transporter [Burkholderiaceae bacterium]
MIAHTRNVSLLAASQALMLSAVVLSMTLAGILGATLAPDKGLATLPIAAMVVGTAIASIPASLLMRRLGRRTGFLIGAALGIAGSVLAATGLQMQSFSTFVVGHLLLGTYQGFANYFRFAAAEAAGPEQASRAISWVVAGGVVAAFAGPQIAVWGRDWLPQHAFVGSYMAQGLLSLAAMALLSRLDLPRVAAAAGDATRSLREIVAQPALRAAVVGAAVGYAVMIMAMTATPLAMLGCGFGTGEVKPVIQWHVFGMFAPSFFTGALVARFGAPRVMQMGFLLLIGHVAIAASGVEYLHFLSALVLLGVGWNFAFVGGTALLTQTYRPSEQTKVQALNEGLVFSLVALGSLGAGWIYDRFGWATLNLAVLPLLILALIWTQASMRRKPVLSVTA